MAAFAHHDHLLLVGSRGFAYLLPSSSLKCFGYRYSKASERYLRKIKPKAICLHSS
ncbi:MAG: hypothetical protein QS721_01815 [Candidatus Endonucleobacter sp. (ex Gigantidas childressi)]|nr:hypothetical protein [Candidatus Endonucleobacter sp. (ex Gigantidas childressi)]